MLKKPFGLKAVITSVILALLLTLFIGCFANAPSNMDESHSGKYWYYLNRGYPQPWAGVALVKSQVKFPLMTLPFLRPEDGAGTEFVKIIHLGKFVPVFMTAFLIFYLPTFVFAKAVEKYKNLFPLLIVVNIGMFAALLFVYFSWFSRV